MSERELKVQKVELAIMLVIILGWIVAEVFW